MRPDFSFNKKYLPLKVRPYTVYVTVVVLAFYNTIRSSIRTGDFTRAT